MEVAVQGNPQVVAELNKLLKNELTAINQYFLHARMMGHWGFDRMAKKIYDLGRLAVGETVVECLRADLRLETEARTALVAAVTLCESTKDYVSREIVVDILEDAEEHIDFLETELSLVDKVGEQNYLQTQIGEGKESS
jgi:bacterioferritin